MHGANIAISKTMENQRKKPAFSIGSWNVQIMTTGLSDDLCKNNITHKTIVFNKELHQLQVDIAALQETWLPESGNLCEREYTFFWREKAKTRSDNTVMALP